MVFISAQFNASWELLLDPALLMAVTECVLSANSGLHGRYLGSNN